eukprot:scaffold29369_cov57-Cyclotella_meneghiniana.AAC.6
MRIIEGKEAILGHFDRAVRQAKLGGALRGTHLSCHMSYVSPSSSWCPHPRQSTQTLPIALQRWIYRR